MAMEQAGVAAVNGVRGRAQEGDDRCDPGDMFSIPEVAGVLASPRNRCVLW